MVTHNMNNPLATLCNIGNSCYMNSVLYTLRFAPNFTHNLHHLVEFLEWVLQKSTTDKKCLLEHQHKHAQNQQHIVPSKPKSSSLGRNIPGLHGSGGHSWSSKDLVSLENNANGYDTPAVNSAVASTGGSGPLNETSTGEANKCSGPGYKNSVLGGNSIGTAYSSSTGNVCSGARELENGASGGVAIKTNRQLVCETLHQLFHNLTRNEACDVIEPFHAGGLLQAVQSVSTTFEGNQQQDAHEFLMCILDSVRECCQTLNDTLLENPDILKNSLLSSSAPVASKDTAMYISNATTAAATEPKSSSTQFIGRYIFRRRKESLKNAKAFLTREGRSATLTDSVLGVPPTVSNNLTEALAGNEATLPKAAVTTQETSTGVDLLKERVRTLGLNFFCEDFEGVTVSRTRCLSCETVTEQKETMIDIAIPITTNDVSDAVKNPQQFYQDACITQEYFRGDNKYRCEVCSGYTEACRTISFDILPRLLVLQLKRFNGDMEKINSYIPTPFILQCFCRDCFGKSDNEKHHVYRLYSVITHVGARMSVGHYIAYTSSLEATGQNVNCVTDRQRRVLLAAASIEGQHPSSGPDGSDNGGVCTKPSNASEKSASGQLKKLFGSKKASSAGDISKKIKNNVINRFSPSNCIETQQIDGNGVMSTEKPTTTGSNDNFYSIHNIHHAVGSGDFSLNCSNENGTRGSVTSAQRNVAGKSLNLNAVSCQSVACCAVLAKTLTNHQQTHNETVGSVIGEMSAGDCQRKVNYHHLSTGGALSAPACGTNCSNHHLNYHPGVTNGDGARTTTPGCQSSLGSAALHGTDTVDSGTGASSTRESVPNQQLTWYMCDDDKIKIMSQSEFEEMLSPNRRHVITPYLLFYARYDVQHNQHQSHPQSQSPSPPQQQQPEQQQNQLQQQH